MRRPEKHFWYYVAITCAVVLLGLSGQLISCAQAHPGDSGMNHSHRYHPAPEPVAPWNHPGPSVQSTPDVSMGAQLDRGAILQHGDGIVRVEVSVDTNSEQHAVPRRASDVVVVVDTSGSMDGQKIHFARQALLELFERLDDGDRFGLVEYNSRARVLVPLRHASEHNKDHFRAVTRQLYANGSTNMSEGLDHASQMLRGQRSQGRPGRVLLLSDGLANAGDSSLPGLTRRASALSYDDYALTAMGIGDDFDERLMTSLATAGTGAFYYLAKLSYLPEFFDNELSSTRETYAQGAEIHFEPAPGVTLLSAMGLPVEHRGGKKVVRLGSLYGSRTRTVWLTLRVPSHHVGNQDLGHLGLSYKRNGQPGYTSVGALPPVICLNDYDRFRDEIHQHVWERALLNDVFTTTEEQFGDAIRSGSRSDLYGALKHAEQERKLARSLGSEKVINKLDELKQKAEVAESAQSAPAPVRNSAAKKSKARGYQMRNKDVYEDSAAAMEAY